MAGQPNAILAISSTDRYITNLGGNANQPFSNTLQAQYFGTLPYSNSFSITAPNALMNGYIEKIIVSQIQIQYNLPTIQPGNNDILYINVETSVGSSVYVQSPPLTIPYGFYSPDEMAAIIAAVLNQFYGDGVFQVVYSQSGGPTIPVGFEFTCGRRFFFPAPGEFPAQNLNVVLKLYKLLGLNLINNLPSPNQNSNDAPNFLYTPYIDILSDALTNYQRLKDTDSSTSRRKGLISRMYLSGVGNPQTTSVTYYDRPIDPENPGAFRPIISQSDALGSKPFVLTFDLNNPKIINWTPDTAVNSLDFELRDCYGDLLFVADTSPNQNSVELFNSEFQITLLCVEKEY
tara:strand:- start:198 stop:1235 length:1038 start_codon:yes stop_codon:yes gene_type:complete